MSDMISNPGGQLDPEEILGRDDLIGEIWKILQGRCVYMNDLRRIGKTQIMVKMYAEPRPGWVCVKRDLGRCHTAEEFARQAFNDSASVLSGGQKAMRSMGQLLGKGAGAEIAGVLKLPDGSPAPWKEVLERTFRDIEDSVTKNNKRMLFLWDEVPFLIDNIAKRQSAQTAMEVLDVIRALTQDFNHVRVLLTGSIGLHHVLESLRKEGYSGSPLNRMELISPGPLSAEKATRLAAGLLKGDGIQVPEDGKCAAAIAASVGHVPFYIHKLISRLQKGTIYTAQSLSDVLDAELANVNSDWDLEHYRKRLADYYGNHVPIVLAILDTVATRRTATFDEIRSAVSSQREVDDETIRDLIKLLCKDHYLVHDTKRTYRFYLAVVARWWRISRDLSQEPRL